MSYLWGRGRVRWAPPAGGYPGGREAGMGSTAAEGGPRLEAGSGVRPPALHSASGDTVRPSV